jgi:hypothetical protein
VYAAPFVCRSARPDWFLHDVGVLIFFGALVLSSFTVATLVALLPGVIALKVLLPALGISSPLPEIGRLGYALLFLPLVPFVLAIAMPFLEALTRPVFEVARALYRLVFRKNKFPDAEDACGQGLFDHLQKTEFPPGAEVVYGVVGHTHRPDVQVLEHGEDRRYVYVNSGTWAPSWRDKRSNLRVGTEFSFLRFEWKPRKGTDRGEYRHRSLVWRDDRNGSLDNVIIARR